MLGEPAVAATVLFSIITGTAASILSLLTIEILRRSPFGRAVLFLSLVLAVFVLYHVILLLVPGYEMVAHTVKSAMFTGVAVVVWLLVWSQRRVRRRAGREGTVG